MVLKHWANDGFQGFWSEINKYGFDKDCIEEMLWFESLDECWISGILVMRQEIIGLISISIRECYGFEALDECWISGILVRRQKSMVLIRISMRRCYGFDPLGECWISGILFRRQQSMVLIRISIRECYGFETLGECWISGITLIIHVTSALEIWCLSDSGMWFQDASESFFDHHFTHSPTG